MFNEIIQACQFLLHNYPGAQETKDYLNSRLSEDSQNIFQFGYFPDLSNLSALTSLVGEDILQQAKLLYSKEIQDALGPRTAFFSYFEHYPLIMPFKDPYGQIAALVGRSLLSDTERKDSQISKYKNTQFTKGNFLFGLHENKQAILQHGEVFIVEGQFDVIKAREKGMLNVLALGTSNMTHYQFSVICRYTNNIILLLDNDPSGEKGRKLVETKFGTLANIKNLYLPKDYKDIDECFSSGKYQHHSEIPFSY